MLDELETILSGGMYIVEVISFMMWVNLEGTKFSMFGISTALRNENIKKARQCLEETGTVANAAIWEWLVLYGFPASPSWPAYYAFNYMANIALGWRGGEIAEYELMISLGFHRDMHNRWRR